MWDQPTPAASAAQGVPSASAMGQLPVTAATGRPYLPVDVWAAGAEAAGAVALPQQPAVPLSSPWVQGPGPPVAASLDAGRRARSALVARRGSARREPTKLSFAAAGASLPESCMVRSVQVEGASDIHPKCPSANCLDRQHVSGLLWEEANLRRSCAGPRRGCACSFAGTARALACHFQSGACPICRRWLERTWSPLSVP